MRLPAVLAAALLAAPAAATPGAQILGYELGSRPASLGGAYVGLAEGASAIDWNPGGLSETDQAEILGAQSRWLDDFALYHAAYAHPLLGGGLGASLTQVNYGSFARIDNTGTGAGTYTAGDWLGSVGYGKDLLPGIGVGAAFKFYRQTLESESAEGEALDLGATARLSDWRFGLALQNLGPPERFGTTASALPLALRAGASYSPVASASLAADWVEEPGLENSFRLGGEYRTPSFRGLWAALRLGYRTTSGLIGLSYGFAICASQWELALAVAPLADFQDMEWLSFSWRFAGSSPHRALLSSWGSSSSGESSPPPPPFGQPPAPLTAPPVAPGEQGPAVAQPPAPPAAAPVAAPTAPVPVAVPAAAPTQAPAAPAVAPGPAPGSSLSEVLSVESLRTDPATALQSVLAWYRAKAAAGQLTLAQRQALLERISQVYAPLGVSLSPVNDELKKIDEEMMEQPNAPAGP